jgi:hypothetical protein
MKAKLIVCKPVWNAAELLQMISEKLTQSVKSKMRFRKLAKKCLRKTRIG